MFTARIKSRIGHDWDELEFGQMMTLSNEESEPTLDKEVDEDESAEEQLGEEEELDGDAA